MNSKSSLNSQPKPWFLRELPWKGLFCLALLPVLLFGLFALAGGRGSIEVLSQLRPMGPTEAAVGFLYLCSYALMAFLSPVFAIAGVLTVIWNLFISRVAY